ncbi:uncharacterized protein LOC111043524 [Nilaparvata lugens]|uniref:uncharacterized protein LOC111043524 n=1 Tax=Nilaparvata lugens TaxID=108931 RepID=UPI00193E60C9|nr:uncharacterized protein LOC111043524 [Nilaparvata lugens]
MVCYKQVAVVCALAGVACALPQVVPAPGNGFFDVFSWGFDHLGYGGPVEPLPIPIGEGAKSDNGAKAENICTCKESDCQCCIDMSLAYIDIGGPSCVFLKYVSLDEGLRMNISYGDSLLHGATVNETNPGPICMNLLSDLAQVCASMKRLRKDGDGLKGCASIEPAILGEIQAEYPLSCFKMTPTGMVVDEEEKSTVAESSEQSTEENVGEETSLSTPKPEVSEEALIAAVNESAEEGIAWFSSLLGFSFGGAQSADNATATAHSSNTTAQLTPPHTAHAQEVKSEANSERKPQDAATQTSEVP